MCDFIFCHSYTCTYYYLFSIPLAVIQFCCCISVIFPLRQAHNTHTRANIRPIFPKNLKKFYDYSYVPLLSISTQLTFRSILSGSASFDFSHMLSESLNRLVHLYNSFIQPHMHIHMYVNIYIYIYCMQMCQKSVLVKCVYAFSLRL